MYDCIIILVTMDLQIKFIFYAFLTGFLAEALLGSFAGAAFPFLTTALASPLARPSGRARCPVCSGSSSTWRRTAFCAGAASGFFTPACFCASSVPGVLSTTLHLEVSMFCGQSQHWQFWLQYRPGLQNSRCGSPL